MSEGVHSYSWDTFVIMWTLIFEEDIQYFPNTLSVIAGAAVVGGGADAGGAAAEEPAGGAEEARAGAGGAGDPHPGAGAEHHHPPAVPGETSRGEPAGKVQTQPAEAEGREPHQPALR